MQSGEQCLQGYEATVYCEQVLRAEILLNLDLVFGARI